LRVRYKGQDLDKDELIRLIELPNHLRKTMLAVISLGKANAEEVSEQTGGARASESDNLDQLQRMGYVKKKRAGNKNFFSPI
jgi:predicted transcriptional regulator